MGMRRLTCIVIPPTPRLGLGTYEVATNKQFRMCVIITEKNKKAEFSTPDFADTYLFVTPGFLFSPGKRSLSANDALSCASWGLDPLGSHLARSFCGPPGTIESAAS